MGITGKLTCRDYTPAGPGEGDFLFREKAAPQGALWPPQTRPKAIGLGVLRNFTIMQALGFAAAWLRVSKGSDLIENV
jgi:hypothetical protein